MSEWKKIYSQKMRIYAKSSNNEYHVLKFLKFVHVYFMCTKIIKNSTYSLYYVPKCCTIGT